MKVAILNNGEVLQTYVQLTINEAGRIVEFLKKQQTDYDELPASHTERTVYEDFTENRIKPETSKGIITFAIVED